MNRKRSFRRRQKPPFSERAKDHCRKLTAFMFSNVGIILLVVLYMIAGAFMFQAIEISQANLNKPQDKVPSTANDTNSTKLSKIDRAYTVILEDLFNISCSLSQQNKTEFYIRIDEKLFEFQRSIIEAQLEGVNSKIEEDWTFSSSFLYSLTVITTIGYGNIAPKSIWGKITTIIYAIIGMPLFLLYLSNIGDILAKSFKWTYAKLFLCRICPAVTRRRAIREKRKMRQMTAEREMNESTTGSESSAVAADCTGTGDSYSRRRLSYQRNIYNNNKIGALNDEEEGIDDDDDDDDDTEIENEIQETATITVPLTVCICIMIGYILFGATLFHRWENWKLLDGSYFCFISLSSIGFGDIVPGEKITGGSKNKGPTKIELSFILCSIYLLLGMALIAMCFNLMQEQVMHNMQSFKRLLRACFRCNRNLPSTTVDGHLIYIFTFLLLLLLFFVHFKMDFIIYS